MKSLVFLWEFSLALCAVGALALAALVVARILSGRSRKSVERLRGELFPVLLTGGEEVVPLSGRALAIVAQLTSELAELTRGSEREAMLGRATAMGVPGLLERRLSARSAQVRLEAVETIALFSQCAEATARALDDPNPDVRLGAALALAHRDDAPPLSVLVEKLKVGTEERSLLLVSLMSDLAEHNPGEVAAILFERDMPTEAKVAATDALSQTGGEYAPLLAFMATESAGEPDLQPRIFRALGRNGHPAAARAILNGLDSGEWPVRASAAEAAGRSGVADAAPRLGELLADENWWVRFRAGEALLRLGPRGINALREAMADEGEDDTRRTTATAILAEGRAA